MSGKGKARKSLGKRPLSQQLLDESSEEEEEEVYELLDETKRVTKPSIRRLAKRGGVQRINGEVYDAAREYMQRYVDHHIGSSTVFMKQSRRKTITRSDVRDALKNSGRPLYSEQC